MPDIDIRSASKSTDVHASTFEAQLRQAAEQRKQAETELAAAKKEIATMKDEVETARRKFELREKLLADKELMNAEREALLSEQLELLRQDREDLLSRLDSSAESNSFVGVSESAMQRKLDEIEAKITGGFKVLLEDPGDSKFKSAPKAELEFQQAHIVKVKDLETREKILAGKERQLAEASDALKQQVDARLAETQVSEQKNAKV